MKTIPRSFLEQLIPSNRVLLQILPSIQKGVCLAMVGIVLATGGELTHRRSASAQYSACKPPNAGEYLLLVVSKTPEAQAKVRSVLSQNRSLSVCNYYQDVVTRIGGFRDANTATSWSNYFNETVGLQAFVARPSANQASNPPASQPAPQPTNQASNRPTPQPAAPPKSSYNGNFGRYNPQLLGSGYAVLVKYYSRPEVAQKVQQTLNRNIGLVSYGQRPYLLAAHTTDQKIANTILQNLSDRGFAAMLVDGRRVTLLRAVVTPPSAIGGQ